MALSESLQTKGEAAFVSGLMSPLLYQLSYPANRLFIALIIANRNPQFNVVLVVVLVLCRES